MADFWRAGVLAALTLALCGAARAQTEALAAVTPASVVEPDVEQSIQTRLSSTDRMLASVTIDGKGPYAFIVDTAAERSVISRELAEALALPEVGRSRLLSMTSVRDVTKVAVPDLSFLPGKKRDIEAFILRETNIGAAGVLGIDALRGQRVVLDFKTQQLHVGPAPRRRANARVENEVLVRARSRYGQLVLADSHIGGEPVDVIIDSGLQVSVGNDALRRLLTTGRNRVQTITLISVTGETFTAEYTRANKLVIGEAAFMDMPVAFAQAPFFARMKLTRRPALLLGMDSLRLFERVSVDFPNREASFLFPPGVRRERDSEPGG
ncbi:MAG: aspartyl protease family protein [Hyphomonadaceae bacterium]